MRTSVHGGQECPPHRQRHGKSQQRRTRMSALLMRGRRAVNKYAADSTCDPSCPYFSFFSRFPSISNGRFSPPTSTSPVPLSASPVMVSLYSTMNLLSPVFRSAEKVRSASFSFTSLSLSSFWSGQFIVPASLSPSFVIVSV